MERFVLVLICLLLLTAVPTSALASPQSVQVALPTFKVTLNGTPVESLYREYPLIVYDGVTYFPMTYYDCRYLGLQTDWQPQAGLGINNTGISGMYRDYKRNGMNNHSATASVVDFPVHVNGKTIDNANEEYPLLLFRGLTYFPLTWRFAVDEFGWKYSFTPSDGLMIQSTNPAVQKLDIPLPTNLAPDSILFAVFDGGYYAIGEKGVIYRGGGLFGQQWTYREAVYQLPVGWDGKYARASLFVGDGGNNLYLRYNTGRSDTGNDVTLKLRLGGGSFWWEEVSNGRLVQKDYGNVLVRVEQSVPPVGNNLYVKYWDGGDLKPVGDPDYIYGWIRTGGGYAPSQNLYRFGDDDDIYVLALNESRNDAAAGLYKVNAKTSATIRLVDDPVSRFIINGNSYPDDYFIYYISAADNRIYRMPLQGGTPAALTPPVGGGTVITDMQVLTSGDVFYTARTGEKAMLFRAGDAEPLNFGANCRYISGNTQNDNSCLSAIFTNEDGNDYRFIVYNANGDAIFKTSDEPIPSTIDVSPGWLHYVDASLKQAGEVSLP